MYTRKSNLLGVSAFYLNLGLRFSWGRQHSGVTLLQRTFGSITVQILKSLGGFRVSRSDFSSDGPLPREEEDVKPKLVILQQCKCRPLMRG
jgi:hypothetical protein